MSVKSLKKQLAAAIAMTVVAAIALSSSTYAWFVSNNTVEATTSSISAQSNAPFLVIKAGAAVETTTTDTAVTTTPVADKVLFPVQMITASDDATTFTWQSAYAAAKGASTEKASTRFTVDSADYAKYYLMESFYVGTNGTTKGQFKNLRVSGVSTTAAGISGGGTDLQNALRIMVVCGQEVVIYDKDGTLITQYVPQSGTATNITGLTAKSDRTVAGATVNAAFLTTTDKVIGKTDGTADSVKVDVYLYYDGAQTDIYTDNLNDLGKVSATVTFTADDASVS
ncbi:MAG: hypothetical protein Q4B67_00050 [Eubacteriales bacterium]|nr:hypothetical protein [Eubacteriales bacterium]